jgi:hypothetical protein
MKKLSIIAVAILLSLGGAAMASQNSEESQDSWNTTGANPYMPEFSTPAARGASAFAQYSPQHHVVKHRVEK